MPANSRIPVAATLVAAGAAACVIGLIQHRLWTVLPWARVGDNLVLVFASLLFGLLVRRWRGWAFADALACVWIVALVALTGVVPALATALLAGAAVACGSLLLPRGAARIALSLPVGLVLIGGIVGWTLRWPIHHSWVYVPVLLGACIARAGVLRELASGMRDAWGDAVDAAPRVATLALLAIGLASVGCWLPTMQADDLAYHLALPSQLQHDASYLPDPAQQIWALAPWLGDVLQGIVQVVGGREGRTALDALWLVAALIGLWHIARRLRASVAHAWLVLALFGSQPLLAALLGGMQTELPASALLLAFALTILLARETQLMLAGAVLAAGLVALKFGSAVAALVVLAWAVLRARGRIAWARVPIAAVVFFALAGSSYVLAWRMSGNPLLPLFNDVFRSPLLPPLQLADPRWHAGFGIALPWSMTFETARYLEAWNGAFGFVLIALAGAWLLALVHARTRGVALAASALLLLPLLPMQYARYAFPGLVLLLPALVVAMNAAIGARRTLYLGLAVCVLDLLFQANATWLLQVSSVRRLVGSGGDVGAVYRRYAATRALVGELRRRDDGDSVVLALDPQSPYVAELGRRGRSVSHYAPALEAARIEADADTTGLRWQQLIRGIDARWLLLHPARLSAPARTALASLGARRVAAIGDAELWSVSIPVPQVPR